MKILYIGNKLSEHGKNPTTIETLGPKLSHSFETILVSSKKNKLLRLIHMWCAIIFERDVDKVLIDTYSSKAFFYAWTCGVLSSISKKKYIAFIHGGDFPNRIKKSKYLTKNYLRNSAEIITPSNYLAEEIEKVFMIKPRVVSNFIDISNYPFLLKNSGKIKLLWVRAFKELYNPTMAIEILKYIRNAGFKANLCMVGPDVDGSLKKCIDLTKKYELENMIEFTGLLTKEKWINLSKNYNIFINTTNYDNQPVSVIEAMALGFPIISTNVGGMKHLIKNDINGYLFDPNCPAAFGDAIIDLSLNKKKMKSFSTNSRQIAEKYTWKVIKKLWVNILKK